MTLRQMFKRDLMNGDINFDTHFRSYLYEYHDDGWTDEILLGETEDKAFETYCDINYRRYGNDIQGY